jgi:hypothetical protein
VAQLYPRTLSSLSFASYDSQGYGGGILTRLHTGHLARSNASPHLYCLTSPLEIISVGNIIYETDTNKLADA